MATKITSKKATSKKPVRKQESSFGSKVKRFLFKALLWFFGLSIFSVVVFKFVPVPFTPLMVIRYFENVADGKENHFSHDWEPIENISMNLQKAVIASEDGTFLTHNGFDFLAMQKAYKSNERGRRIKGGSTISQQTAKNVFLWQGRSWIRKGLEAVYTFIIELVWSKDIILERYLNSIEMGRGVFGVEAASEYYFKKNAKDLTKSEAAWIAAILPNPKKYDPKNPSSYLKRKHSWIMRQMNNVNLK